MPTVSVVLPTYNGEKYIRESIESILGQTLTDWELIIVDDYSTDSTPEIAEEYAAADPRIRVIHNDQNQKLPGSLNIGFRQARGSYLTWTSDDNMYLTYALEAMAEYLEAHKEAPMVCAGALFLSENKEYLFELPPYKDDLMFMDDVVGACFMYRRSVLNTVGEYSREFFCVEDYEYWIRILQKYGTIGYLRSVLYLYRYQAENSLTVSKAAQVQQMRSKMRCKHIDWILSGISGKESLLIRLYNELLKDGCVDEGIKARFEKLIPELAGERGLERGKRIVIFGAGKMGRQACGLLGGRAAAFADSDQTKVGQSICGLDVLDLNTLKTEYERGRCQVVVGSRDELQIEMMRCLQKIGVRHYSVWTRLCAAQ